MSRVALGDAAAQRALVKRLLSRVDRLCRALLRNAEDAKDARQLSLVEILRAARNFRGDSSIERWGDRITVRTALRAVASERKARRTPIEPELPDGPRGAGESAVLAKECLDRLSDRQRIVLVLRHALDYSIDEIAAMEGVTANTVKDRLLRARGTMRRMFRRDEFLTSDPLRLRGDDS